MTRDYDINAGFPKLNGVWRYVGSIVTTKSNQDTTTPFLNATATLTLATTLATHTVVFTPVDGGRIVTLTASAAPTGDSQWDIGGDDTADAAALVVVINAHPLLSRFVVATSSAGVVTLTARQGCPLLNITQGVGATITIARGGFFGQTFAGKNVVIQAAADTRVGWGATSALAITQADATTGFALAQDAARVHTVPDEITHLASTGGTLRVYQLL